MRPNNSFKPTPHRGVNSVLCATLHAVATPLRGGLTLALDMRAKYSKVLAIALAAFGLASCAGTLPRALPDPVELPVLAEPAFQTSSYSALPPDTKMTVLWSSAELIAQLKRRFPALNSNRSSLLLVEEQLILSNGSPNRRVWFSYGDEATTTMHGACSQNIYMWFMPSGDLAGTYVEQLTCPI